MKTLLLAVLLLGTQAQASWEKPAIACPEDIFPKGYICPDLTRVENIWNDFPVGMSAAEIEEWKSEKAPDLKLCRYQEILRREKLSPGTFTPVQIQIAWMVTEGGKSPEKKLQAAVNASTRFGIPPHVLIGAITQESLLASLGVSPDGGNYSCGIAQLNISEWCLGMAGLSAPERSALGWPAVNCSSVKSSHVAPHFMIARTRLGSRPEYAITARDFDGIKATDVGQSETLHRAVTSFIKNCQNDELSIRFKALNLKNLFTGFVPSPLRNAERLSGDNSSCRIKNTSGYYPLHTGWLLAVASYNAGPRVVSLVEHYYGVKNNQFPAMTPKDLVEALHWGGKINTSNNTVVFTGQNGRTLTQSWYKSCVVQRHVSRVVQHVTLPGQKILSSLEKIPCATGPVPEYRRDSSGRKNKIHF